MGKPIPPDVIRPVESGVRTIRDLWIIGIFAALCFIGLVVADGFERFADWSRAHEGWQIDELLMLCAVLMTATAVFAVRRWQELRRESVLRQETEANVRRLERILNICAFCKQIRHDGAWIPLEIYVGRHMDADFSHGLCPGCAEQNYPEYFSPDKPVQ